MKTEVDSIRGEEQGGEVDLRVGRGGSGVETGKG
jgi:hypothetical protein